MLSDIQIAQNTTMKPISQIAQNLDLLPSELISYGPYKAKITQSAFDRLQNQPDGKLVLVTAVNPTPAGEGKTTTTVGLGQAMNQLGLNSVIALREPSLGPVFGVKGGAAGGGYAQVVPMEDINLHFTGDMHAIGAANNLLCALIDNHIKQGNDLNLDPVTLLVPRAVDMNDRALRQIVIALGGPINGVPREDSFLITVASEVMAILCLAEDLVDLKERLGNILIGYDYHKRPVYAKDLNAQGAMAALLKDAIHPNLVQTLENTPAIMHGGPFANIAHGCNSIRATRLALKLGDYCITEAGFGSDLGAEKFFDIKCAQKGLTPNCVVIVATVKALKYNGGVDKKNLSEENLEALALGIQNLGKHIQNMRKFGVPVVVALNSFHTDTNAETEFVEYYCREQGASFALSEVFSKGGEGGIALAEKVVEACETKPCFTPIYNTEDSIVEKIETLTKEIYGGVGVSFSNKAMKAIRQIEEIQMDKLPICVAKTQYSFSDNPALLGAPSNFSMEVKNVKLSSGAGFIVVYCGDVMTMPGLPKVPAANHIDIDKDGNITGIF